MFEEELKKFEQKLDEKTREFLALGVEFREFLKKKLEKDNEIENGKLYSIIYTVHWIYNSEGTHRDCGTIKSKSFTEYDGIFGSANQNAFDEALKLKKKLLEDTKHNKKVRMTKKIEYNLE